MFSKITIAMLCVTAIAITGLIKGLDGALLIASVSAIGTLAGVEIGRATSSQRQPK